MKISHMIEREDFYMINEKTLKSFYQGTTHMNSLYVYPNLNAIVTRRPSKAVRKYLYTEYQVNGSLVKKMLVSLYCKIMLNSLGLFAAKKLLIPNRANDNTLIYPCNKKYRIFDFEKGVVSVVLKAGFPKEELEHEISFRVNHKADFIPSLIEYDTNGYVETIIDGYPVARAGVAVDELSIKAYKLWQQYSVNFMRTVTGHQYSELIDQKIETEIEKLKYFGKNIDFERVRKYATNLLRDIDDTEEIQLVLSHGDLQAGNIWIENKTDNIIIIDWETFEERSVYYDQVVLFERIRYTAGLRKFIENDNDERKAIVLAEDLIYRLKELTCLPKQFGVDDFAQYIDEVKPEYV